MSETPPLNVAGLQNLPATSEFEETSSQPALVSTHTYPDDVTRTGALRLGVIERMSESSDRYEELLSQLGSR